MPIKNSLLSRTQKSTQLWTDYMETTGQACVIPCLSLGSTVLSWRRHHDRPKGQASKMSDPYAWSRAHILRLLFFVFVPQSWLYYSYFIGLVSYDDFSPLLPFESWVHDILLEHRFAYVLFFLQEEEEARTHWHYAVCRSMSSATSYHNQVSIFHWAR